MTEAELIKEIYDSTDDTMQDLAHEDSTLSYDDVLHEVMTSVLYGRPRKLVRSVRVSLGYDPEPPYLA